MMPDREEVIKALENGILIAESIEGEYVYITKGEARKVLELLSARQKTPVVIFERFDGSIESECGNCGLYLDKTYSVCPKCGKELDWNA